MNRSISMGGQSLDPATRAHFESAFQHDFSEVRVHSDQRAAESAGAFGARAYTVGKHVVFGSQRYQPGSAEGRRLIGHELGHVVQQSRGGNAPSSRGSAMALEADARRATADALTETQPARVAGAVAPGLQMDAEVYIWNPHVDGYGHAAMKLCDGTYISWWPVAAGTGKKDQYWSGRPGGANTYANDIGPGGENHAPDAVYNLGCNCLDEAAIKTWYTTNFSGNPSATWSVLQNSCSDVAHKAINAGSSVTNPCYLSLSHTNAIWTPKDLGSYAACQERWCASKKAGVLNATGRYLWENIKEISGGAAINTLRSLWWKGEILTH